MLLLVTMFACASAAWEKVDLAEGITGYSIVGCAVGRTKTVYIKRKPYSSFEAETWQSINFLPIRNCMSYCFRLGGDLFEIGPSTDDDSMYCECRKRVANAQLQFENSPSPNRYWNNQACGFVFSAGK
jgi:hypothetical protein